MTIETFSLAAQVDGDWLQILPPGKSITTRDGRAFQVSDPAKVVAATELPLLLDWEHASESMFGSTEAAGWGDELEARASGIWMRTTYTPKGQTDVDSKAYCYLSPVLVIDAESRDVQQIVSVALTNKAALAMSPIGDLSAFRARATERIRIACSTMREISGLTAKERAKLHARGIDDASIATAEQYNRMRLATMRAEPSHDDEGPALAKPFVTDRERVKLRAKGLTDVEIDASLKHLAEQPARYP